MADVAANASTTATVTGVDPLGALLVGAYSGELETAHDKDWIRVPMKAGLTYQIVIDGQFAPGTNDDLRATLNAANGDVLATIPRLGTGASGNPNLLDSFSPPVDGDYYLSVEMDSLPLGGATYNMLVLAFYNEPVEVELGDYTGGADELVVGAWDSNFVVLGSSSVMFGAGGDDRVYSNYGALVAHGGNGNDSLYGQGGVAASDFMWGGWGNDSLQGAEGSDLLFGDQGNDFLSGDAGDDKVDGGLGNDIVEGENGGDILDGGSGADWVRGGGGDDLIYVDNAGDVVFEAAGAGVDTVAVRVSYTLSVDAEVEKLVTTSLAGTRSFVIIGNDFSQSITGNAGVNTLAGKDGNDVLVGGKGADYLSGGLGRDTASHVNASTGVIVDLVSPAANTGEAAGDTYNSIEWLTGSRFADRLAGNAGANVLTGGDGGDILRGRTGNDDLNGGTGADKYVFDTALNATTNVDRVYFANGIDKIWLDNAIFTVLASTGALAASAFKNLDTGSVDSNDRILYSFDTGNLFYDRDGSGAAYAAVRFAEIFSSAQLSAADFAVI